MQRPDTTTGDSAPAIALANGPTPTLQTLFRVLAAAALAAAVVACGGGGPSSPPASPAPAPPPIPLQAVLSVPDPVGYDDNRLAAFQRLNEVRSAAGLGLLAQNHLLDQAAQAHAEWEVTNDLYQHEETAGTPGFTGETSYERLINQGYPVGPGGETITAGYAPRQAVDSLVNVLYHREILLDFSPVDVGIGWSIRTSPHVWEPMVLEFSTPGDGTPRAVGQTAQASLNGVLVWPSDGATDVLTHMGGEMPNPVPSVESTVLGTPASLSVDYWKAIHVSEFSIRDEASGIIVPAAILTHDTDPNLLILNNYVGAVPLQGLTKDTRYRVHFSGTIANGLEAPQPYVRDWTFTTGDADYPPVGP